MTLDIWAKKNNNLLMEVDLDFNCIVEFNNTDKYVIV